MALFGGLSERLNHIFSKLTKKGRLTELEIRAAMREVRVALLEADVNIKVAKQFIADVSEKAVGQEILSSLNPAQQVIKIVNDELIALMGSKNSKLEVASKPPTVIMMCGLQGAGKTTLCGKLALYLKKQGKKPLLVAGDIYRPAAEKARELGIGLNAGHDLNLHNLKAFAEAFPWLDEVSIGHALIADALYLGIEETIKQYKYALSNSN